MSTTTPEVPRLRLPRFSNPNPSPDPPLPEDENDPTGSPDETSPGPRPSPSESPEPLTPSPGRGERRTSSSTGRPPVVDTAAVAGAISGFLLVVLGFAAWALRRRGFELRVPDEKERAEVADPVARIASRHLDLSMLSPDVADATQAVAATAAYAQTSPLSRGLRVDENVPPQPLPEELEEL